MESNNEFQLLKLKIASEIVRSSQSVVAFSRAFYLEEVLIDKIGNEVKDVKSEFSHLQERIEELLKTAQLEDNIVTETNLRLLSSSLQSELDRHFNESHENVFQGWDKRVMQAEARRQAKSSLLQQLSTSNEIMGRFESLTLKELREIHVPEFSCFINESDFGQLEQLNEEWSLFRKDSMKIINCGREKIESFKLTDLCSYRKLQDPSHSHSHHHQYHHQVNASTLPSTMSDLTVQQTFNGRVEEEIGKTFANRSGNVLRKFGSLLRRGNRKSKTFSDSFDEKEES